MEQKNYNKLSTKVLNAIKEIDTLDLYYSDIVETKYVEKAFSENTRLETLHDLMNALNSIKQSYEDPIGTFKYLSKDIIQNPLSGNRKREIRAAKLFTHLIKTEDMEVNGKFINHILKVYSDSINEKINNLSKKNKP